jgi:hypothetical protein
MAPKSIVSKRLKPVSASKKRPASYVDVSADVPNEILEMIMTALVRENRFDTSYRYGKWPRDLQNWSLVCRDWRPAAQRLLFGGSDLSNDQVLRLYGSMLEWSVKHDSPGSEEWSREEFNDANPFIRLIPCIQTLHIPEVFCEPDDGDANEWYKEPLLQYLMKNVAEVSFTCITQDAPEYVGQLLSNVTTKCRSVRVTNRYTMVHPYDCKPILTAVASLSEDPGFRLEITSEEHIRGSVSEIETLDLARGRRNFDDLEPNPIGDNGNQAAWGELPPVVFANVPPPANLNDIAGEEAENDDDFVHEDGFIEPPLDVQPCPVPILRDLSKFTYLWDLDLSNQVLVNDECLRVIADNLPELGHLHLSGCTSITDDGVQMLMFKHHHHSDVLQCDPITPFELCLPNLIWLDLSGTLLTNRAFSCVGLAVVLRPINDISQAVSFYLRVEFTSISRNGIKQTAEDMYKHSLSQNGEELWQSLSRRAFMVLSLPLWEDEADPEVDEDMGAHLMRCGIYWSDWARRRPQDRCGTDREIWQRLLRQANRFVEPSQ